MPPYERVGDIELERVKEVDKQSQGLVLVKETPTGHNMEIRRHQRESYYIIYLSATLLSRFIALPDLNLFRLTNPLVLFINYLPSLPV